jgi:hypothetical protein
MHRKRASVRQTAVDQTEVAWVKAKGMALVDSMVSWAGQVTDDLNHSDDDSVADPKPPVSRRNDMFMYIAV